MTTVAGCIQQIPPDNSGRHTLEIREVEATAENYLEAVAKLDSEVPEGWRVIVVRTVEPHPADSHAPTH